MTKRFRMIAGSNGSGKSTLADLLRRDYAAREHSAKGTSLPWGLVSMALLNQ